MKFFIPFATDPAQEQNVYDGIRKFLAEELGAVFTERMVFSIRYHHEGKSYYAEVGKEHAMNKEPVIAILYEEMRKLYHVCTPNRGVVRGGSILVGWTEVEEVTDFDMTETPES